MEYLSDRNFSTSTELQKHLLHDELDAILAREYHGNLFELMANYQRVLADNNRRSEWRGINDKLHTLFMAGMAVPMDGPMVGSTVSLRDSDYFREISQLFG